MTAAALITPADLATELGTDARTTRKFLRSITPRDEQPGKGSRWGIKSTKANLADLRKKFTAFETAQIIARDAREAKKAQSAAEVKEIDEVTEDDNWAIDTIDALDSLDDPTDAELLDD